MLDVREGSKTCSTGAFTSVETFTFAIVNPPAVVRQPSDHVDSVAGNSIIRPGHRELVLSEKR